MRQQQSVATLGVFSGMVNVLCFSVFCVAFPVLGGHIIVTLWGFTLISFSLSAYSLTR